MVACWLALSFPYCSLQPFLHRTVRLIFTQYKRDLVIPALLKTTGPNNPNPQVSYEVFLSGLIYAPLPSTLRPLHLLAPSPLFACSCLKFQLKHPASENPSLASLTQQCSTTSHHGAGNTGIWMVKVIKQLFLGHVYFSVCMLGFDKVVFVFF